MSYKQLGSACLDGNLATAEAVLAPLSGKEQRDLLRHSSPFNSYTPLHLACMCGHLAVAEMLIDRGADLMAKDKDDRTPLHLACETGQLVTAEMLISKGADVEAKDKNGKTPLDQCTTDEMRRQLSM
eukprot:TRINITY_DN12203_c2_g4_i7.p2 TRINITY_DN12203_c2_g4~~TRINITY_DN12203_c2_g4_i7.p2  ORF type:complete len:127 (+),score=18.47 TRINITY_DN12203_c2_g4_i7:85-465(+)